MLVDTHAHIHFAEFEADLKSVFANADASGVQQIITVGTNEIDSKKALEFVYSSVVLEQARGIELYATAGLHPHEASNPEDALLTIEELVKDGGYGKKLVAIGECGLDFFKNHSEKRHQYKALEFQLQLASETKLPLVFHVRDAWEDFFAIIKNYSDIRGVIHSFTGGMKQVDEANGFGLYFGLNGIMTFSKDQSQLEAAKQIPLNRILLETDCPFLTPDPLRGKRNEPANLKYIAEFLAKLRAEKLEDFSRATTLNVQSLFGLK